MKQFLTCLILSMFIYIGFSGMSKSFNIMLWESQLTFGWTLITLVVWIVPIIVNYLDGNNNFKNS